MIYKPNVCKTFFVGIFLLIFSIEAISQFSFFKNYTVNDGLPSSKIYHMIQDSKGYMWFATENGVSRFDGYAFKNFTTNEGLPTNSTLKLYEDYKGRIWFLSYQGLISFYENDKITSHWVNDLIEEKHINFFDNIYVDSNDVIWLSPFSSGIFKLSETLEIFQSQKMDTCRSNCTYSLYLQIFETGYILGVNEGLDESRFDNIVNQDSVLYINYGSLVSSVFEHKKYLEIDDNEFYISFGKTIRHIENNEIVNEKVLPKRILDVYLDKNNNLWVSTKFDGIYCYPNADLNSKPDHYLSDYSVSRVIQDNSGNYWFSTTENGFFLVPSFDFKCFNISNAGFENEIIYAMEVNDSTMFFSTDKEKIYTIQINEDKLTGLKALELEGGVVNIINDILVASDGSLWVSGSKYLNYTTRGKKQNLDLGNKMYGYELTELMDNSIAMTIQNGLIIYKGSRRIFDNASTVRFQRTFAVHQKEDSTIWLGNIQGLYAFENKEIKKYHRNDSVLNTRISDITSIGNQLWVGTFDNGMAVVLDDSIYHINEDVGLSSNRIKVICVEDEKNIWVGTNNGLNHIILSDNHNLSYSIENYTIWDGLPSNEVNEILKHNDIIWLGTDKGIVSFYPPKLSKIACIPSLYFESILIQEHKYADLRLKSELSYDEHNLAFNYKAICYKNPGNISYAYKLEGVEDNWIITKNTSVRYTDLAPKSYKFIIKAKSGDGLWSDELEYNFKIHKHYTQTVIFRIIVILLALLFVGVVFWMILKYQKNRETLKQQVILAEQKAIRSQMNPHFLFNSLNSIQHLILNKEGEVANYYLTNLSKLMRKVLDNSKYTTIPLKEELENIKLYLDLEKFRFENHFNYSIEISDSITLDEIVIPSMIIQPYLENAIWHGLVPKSEKGNLLLSITRNEQNNLLIVIEDNGIGRQEAERIAKRRKNYKSMGMKNTKERMNLLNRLFNTHYDVSVIDLINDNKNPIGTRVELFMDL